MDLTSQRCALCWRLELFVAFLGLLLSCWRVQQVSMRVLVECFELQDPMFSMAAHCSAFSGFNVWNIYEVVVHLGSFYLGQSDDIQFEASSVQYIMRRNVKITYYSYVGHLFYLEFNPERLFDPSLKSKV